jgi:outer membrane protein OmpA-like peptidoglycan-associated protein
MQQAVAKTFTPPAVSDLVKPEDAPEPTVRSVTSLPRAARALNNQKLTPLQRIRLAQQLGQQYGNQQLQRFLKASKPPATVARPAMVQRVCSTCGQAAQEEEQCEECRQKATHPPKVQRQAVSTYAVPNIIRRRPHEHGSEVIQRLLVVEQPQGGTPTRKNWEDVRDYLHRFAPAFVVDSSGTITAPGSRPTTTGGGCVWDLHSSRNPDPWKIQINDNDWPHTEEGARRVTVHSTSSIFQFGAWGGGAAAGRKLLEDNARVLAHELCGHAWLMERGAHPRGGGVVDGGRPDHDPTVAIENIIAQEMGGGIADQRGSFADPHHGESFARVVISGYPLNATSVGSLPTEMQARLNTVASVMRRDRIIKADIVGHADRTGSVAVNDRVSRQRALNAQTWLVGHSISPGRFLVNVGRGYTECPVTSGEDTNCRKVEIFIFAFEAASESHR